VRFVAVRCVALLVAVIGLVNFLTGWRPDSRLTRVAEVVDGTAPGRTQALVVGLVLLAIARGLVGGRRLAWFGAVGILGIATLATLPHRHGAMLLVGTALVALVSIRGDFDAAPDPTRLRLAGQITGVAAVAALIGGGWAAVSHRGEPGGIRFESIADVAGGAPDSWSGELLVITIATAVVVAVLIALAPARPPAPASPADRSLVHRLTSHADADSLAPFATRADKAYVFDPQRQTAIGYRVVFGTALAGGDPVGPAEHAAAAIRAFLDLCGERGWRPAVLGASDAMVPLWRDAGLHGMRIGDEAVLPVDTWSLESRRMRNVRQAINRTHNAGVRVTIGPLTAAHAEALRPILRDWLSGHAERGFAMNLDAILTPRPDCLVATAYDRAGHPVAFARFARCADGTVLTLDVAPRGSAAPNGVAERMIAEIVEYARRHGVHEVSLNFAAMRWVFDSPAVGPRALAGTLRGLDRWIEIAPLNRFCEKFHPHWRSRSLMMRSWLELGWVAAAALRAELGSGRAVRAVPEPPTAAEHPIVAIDDELDSGAYPTLPTTR
jgi:lysyl-tRNA synthetase class 2